MKPSPNTEARTRLLPHLQAWLKANGYTTRTPSPTLVPQFWFIKKPGERTRRRCRVGTMRLTFDKLEWCPLRRRGMFWQVESFGFYKDIRIENNSIFGLTVSQTIAKKQTAVLQ